MKDMKRDPFTNDNKGFTLVELIVVLLILAILAAILVPALLGYIDEAKKEQDKVDAKACLTAIQSQLAITYGTYKAQVNLEKPEQNFNIFAGMKGVTADNLAQNVYLSGAKSISEFTQNIFDKTGIEKPYMIILYTLKILDIHGNVDVKNAYTAYSIVFWADKNRKPIFYNINTNQWEEGSPYTAGLVIRGSKANSMHKQPNEVISGKFEGSIIMPYVVWVDQKEYNSLNNTTKINQKIEDEIKKGA